MYGCSLNFAEMLYRQQKLEQTKKNWVLLIKSVAMVTGKDYHIFVGSGKNRMSNS